MAKFSIKFEDFFKDKFPRASPKDKKIAKKVWNQAVEESIKVTMAYNRRSVDIVERELDRLKVD